MSGPYEIWALPGVKIMNDPAASRRGILEEFSFKSRGKPRGIKPTGGIELLEATLKLHWSHFLFSNFNKTTRPLENPRELLFISDMDGTLLPENGHLPQSDIDRLNRLIDLGLHFTIATARNYDSVRPILSGLNFKIPVILFNGVYLTDFHSGHNVIESYFIPPKVTEHLLELTLPRKIDPFIYTYGEVHRVYYRGAYNPGSQAYVTSLNNDPRLLQIKQYDIPDNERISGFLLIDTQQALQPVYESLKQAFPDEINVYFAEDVSMKGYYWLQTFHQNANKGRMVKHLVDHLGWSLEKTVVFGDYVNDLDMFKVAGRSVAMSNALPEVKQAAHEVIGSNQNGAVIDYLEAINWTQ
jgi:Cof subfamily protein (haloacid dehalogenase superfamily)